MSKREIMIIAALAAIVFALVVYFKERPSRGPIPRALQRVRQKRLAQEVAAINEHAGKLNSEMSDALSFQAKME